MRYPEEYFERQRIDNEALELLQEREASGDALRQDFLHCQEVFRKSLEINESLPPSAWGFENGDWVYHLGDTGVVKNMYRIQNDRIEIHDRKGWWGRNPGVSAYDLVRLLNSRMAKLLREVPVKFDNKP